MPTPGSAAGLTPTADVEITDDMVRAFASAIDPDNDPFDYPEDAAVARVGLQLVAPQIGAAYLREFAREMIAWGMIAEHAPNQAGKRMLDLVSQRATARADELDGEAQR